MAEYTTLNAWFCQEVLPLEPALTSFIRRHWKGRDEVIDILHDVYEKALSAGGRELPQHTGRYLFTIARNHMITCAKRARIISFDLVADLEIISVDFELESPDKYLSARDDLRRVEKGLNLLPPRCREIVRLRKVEGFSIAEVAARLGLGVDAVQQQTSFGMRALAEYMLGGTGRIHRPRRLPPAKTKSAGDDA